MKQYGDEEFIYRIGQKKPQDDDIAEIVNNINDGYAIIDDNRVEFSERAVFDGQVFMTIPAELELMPPEAVIFKYPKGNRPSIIYTDAKASINICFTQTKDRLDDEDVEEAKEYIERVATTMNPSSKIISSSVIEGNPRIGHFDFISTAVDGDVYNMMFLFSLNGQFILGAFNCVRSVMDKWLDVALQMVKSIRVADANSRIRA
jgi:hypothetical protein